MPNAVAAVRGRGSLGAGRGMEVIVHRRLSHKHTMQKPTMRFMNGATLIVESETKKRWPHGGPGTSQSFRSIRREVHRTGAWGRVFTTVGYGLYVERGRKPGRMPPLRRLQPWARRAGVLEFLYPIARKIGREGTEGHFAMRDGARAAQRPVQRLLGGPVRAEVKAWRKRAPRG